MVDTSGGQPGDCRPRLSDLPFDSQPLATQLVQSASGDGIGEIAHGPSLDNRQRLLLDPIELALTRGDLLVPRAFRVVGGLRSRRGLDKVRLT